ncbi:hypothetical protein TWF506_001837 [Arthrobotrys conoides]|uniref:WHIM1 domain-containing protein n=1 Tax=Arthrobotrys conoides TaxID=74498 RepID=A0AAN8RYF7_9PEZI
MSSRSSSPLSSVQDLSDPELEFTQPSKSTFTTNSLDGKPSRSSQEASPPPNKRRKVVDPRDPLPADNPRYAFIVAFQAKFNQVFRGVPNLGPQDIEAGVAETPISDHIESLLCKLLGLALNRQKPVEKGHYGRALEEAVATYIEEAPPEWEGKNPLEGGKTFNQMTVEERLVMLQTLVLWVLRHSKSVGDILKDVYKPGRKTDDSNVSLAVHCWGMDREKNKYYLIEGKDDTYFRVYQEHISPGYRNATWIAVAGSIEELRDLAERLAQEGSKNAKDLQGKIMAAIPRFEEGEQKRRRREYRSARKAAFSNPGVSMYEGRTRGNKAKYTFDSDEEGGYTSGRATRASRRASPTANEPYVTGSGRVTRRTNQYGFQNDNAGGTSTPYAGSDSGGSARRSGRLSLKRDREEYEADALGGGGGESQSENNEGDDEEDYRDEPVEEMDDDDLSDATDEEFDKSGKSLWATLKFEKSESKAVLKTCQDDDAKPQSHGLPTPHPDKQDDGAMDIDAAEEDVDDGDVDLVPTSPIHGGLPKVSGDKTSTPAPEHVVVNFLSGKGSNSSPASSIGQ